jgi:hypothetical protein
MRKIFKTAVWFHLFALFSFMVSLYSTNLTAAGASYIPNRSHNEESQFLPVPFDLFCFATKNENSIKEYSQLPSVSPKNHFNDLITSEKSTELFLLNKISKYIVNCETFVLSFPQILIIFPFHYFY